MVFLIEPPAATTNTTNTTTLESLKQMSTGEFGTRVFGPGSAVADDASYILVSGDGADSGNGPPKER